jgi:ABC-2 type transport system permease protein
MTAIIVFIGLIIGLNCIPLLTDTTFPKAEKTIKLTLVASLILLLTFTIFECCGYRLKGLYSFTTISWIFIVSTMAYFVIFKNTKQKLLTSILLTPLLVLTILSTKLAKPVYENKIDETYKISVTTGGFLACGEIIHITQTRFGIFDQDVFHIDNLCLIGINKIEIAKLDHKHAGFLIYHNGEQDSENPYSYDVERKNGW